MNIRELQNIANALNMKTYFSEKDNIIQKVLKYFNDNADLPTAKIYKEAKSKSVYIKFVHSKHTQREFGQLRISDHAEKEHLGYRWGLRYDINKSRTFKKPGKYHFQHSYPFSDINRMLEDMSDWYQEIQKYT